MPNNEKYETQTPLIPPVYCPSVLVHALGTSYTSFGENAQNLGDFLGIAFVLVGCGLSVLASYVLALMSQINGLSGQLDVLRAKISTLEQVDIDANRRANSERSKTL